MGGQLQIADDSYLRLLEEAEVRELHALIEANRAHLARRLPWASGQGFDETLDFIRKTRSQASANDGFQASIVIDGSIVGMAGYPGVDWTTARLASATG